MDWPRLDTRWWNLSLGVAATTMAGCGPTITLDDDTGSSVTDTDGDTEGDTDTPPNTTPPPPQCLNNNDCEPGFECIDNICIPYDDYCADGYCCYDYCCYDDCCYGDCYYYECYSNEECGQGGLCGEYGYGSCYYVDPVPNCGDVPPPLLPVPLEEDNASSVVSLSFVDANGDAAEDLVVSHAGGETILYPGGGAAMPVALPLPDLMTPVLSVVAGDFDGNGAIDLAGNYPDGQVALMLGDGMGGFLMGPTLVTGQQSTLRTLDWNGDGNLDLAGLTAGGGATVALGDGAAGISTLLSLDTNGDSEQLQVGTFQEDPFGDVAVNDGFTLWLYHGNDSAQLQPSVELFAPYYGPRTLLADDFDGQGFTDVVSMTEMWNWTLLDTWRDGGNFQNRQALLASANRGDTGDVDGDGLRDAVVSDGGGTAWVLRGSSEADSGPMFQCAYEVGLPFSGSSLAVGDHDGNGSADVVITDGFDVVVLYGS